MKDLRFIEPLQKQYTSAGGIIRYFWYLLPGF